jgi:hypothetical protein
MQSAEERVRLHKRMYELADELFVDANCVVILVSIEDEEGGHSVTHSLCAARGGHHTRQGLAYDYLARLTERCALEPEDREPEEPED